jgi:Flp pilus assembly pilin Flp
MSEDKVRRVLRGFRHDDGAAAVEFALVVWILVVLLIGIAQFGILFYQWLEVCHSAREGARWASLENPDGSVGTPGTTKYKVWEAAPGLTPRLTDEQILIDPPNPDIDMAGQPVEVTVVYDAPMLPLMPEVMSHEGMTFRLQSSATQRIE